MTSQGKTMPIYMDISRMNRLVVIVAKGHVTADEIAANTRTLVEADVPGYAKIIDTTGSNSDLTREQVDKIATLLRGDPKDRTRGPVAFVVNPDRKGFADAFAEVTQGERPIRLFKSLHSARKWLLEGGAHAGAAAPGSALHDGVRVWE
jgi:hypothetical protein